MRFFPHRQSWIAYSIFVALLCVVLCTPLRITAQQRVLTGFDVTEANNFAEFKGKRLALIVNHTSLNAKGEHLIDVMHRSCAVAKLFSPEHGIRGAVDDVVGDTTDTKTGLPVFSLYKKDKKGPSESDMQGIDAVVFDIQEIGVRFYTFASTLAHSMKAAKKAGVPLYVLDRPNPAPQLGVFGGITDDEFLGHFISMYKIPMAHGLTIGELAQYYNKETGINADVRVIKMQQWNRSTWFDQTGIQWHNPSPNIRSMDALIAYHILGAVEFMGVSVGRGTDQPFLLLGAPSFEGISLSKPLSAMNIAGMRFTDTVFTPASSKFEKKKCYGVRVHITDRNALQPQVALISLLKVMNVMFPEEQRTKEWNSAARSIGSRALIKHIMDGESIPLVMKFLDKEKSSFVETAQKYHLYK
jgi:uncharacterized protein YbbC (DUF1343 family)